MAVVRESVDEIELVRTALNGITKQWEVVLGVITPGTNDTSLMCRESLDSN